MVVPVPVKLTGEFFTCMPVFKIDLGEGERNEPVQKAALTLGKRQGGGMTGPAVWAVARVARQAALPVRKKRRPRDGDTIILP